MSLKTYLKSEERKSYNGPFSKQYKEFMLSFDMWWEAWVSWPFRFVTKVFWERLWRGLQFFYIGYGSFDWDSHYLHELMLFKMKRMQKHFIEDGYHSETCENYKPKMKSLALAIKLLERYNEPYHWYYEKSMLKHDLKWGPLMTSSEPADKDPDGYVRTYRMQFNRRNVRTEADEIQEREEFKAAMSQDEARKERDIKLVHAIVAKYHRYWWD